MCGIFGYFDRSGTSLAPGTMQMMGSKILHRGPDDDGFYEGRGVGVGNKRLSIIDVAHGHQPFVSDDQSVFLVQNGEIFNHVELSQDLAASGYRCRTHSDTEVLLRLYERDGLASLSQLNGMFAIAIYDVRQDALYLIRDRIGVKPLYVHYDGNRLLFASEIKSLLAAGVKAELDNEALHHFLSYNYVTPPFTLFRGIRHLKPGHCLRIDRQGVREWRWWNLADACPERAREETSWMEEFNAILDDAVRLRLRTDVPFGAFLSGGVDSSTILGMMSRHVAAPVRTFCIGFDDPRYDESSFAQAAADRFGASHTMRKVAPNMLDLWPKATWHCDQPHGDISFLPTYRVSELAAEQVKVVLTGDGGDELFAGYDKYLNFFANAGDVTLGSKDFQSRYYHNICLFRDDEKFHLYRPGLARYLRENQSSDLLDDLWSESEHWDRINQALYIDMQLLLPGNNLVKPDRMGMAVSLEARTPFLDYRMMEFAFRMPGDLKLRKGETKYIYKKAVTPLIGRELAYRKKQMFTVPVGEWFRAELYSYVSEMLLGKESQLHLLFEPSKIRKLVEAHHSGAENRTRELRALIAIEIWLRCFKPEINFAA